MNRQYALIAVEGNHDQAFVAKVIKKILNFQEFNGSRSELEPFWRKFIPKYDEKYRKLYARVNMPSILFNDKLSVGIYILPNNSDHGVLETLLCQCGEIAYPDYIKRANTYINQFTEAERNKLKWKPFDDKKAIIATIASILKPGKTNTVSIKDNNWISDTTKKQVTNLASFVNFLEKLLNLD
ncbi:MAG: hypothetical protein QNJ33_07980 [Crocosphaera sp.]|nr:hypothetical protein [Crocosphaera sp.]